ncbi:MAG TPA: hypothetical protein VKB51_18485 [bacterium]|nr:hypothetical protein [bacterium]
MNSTPHKATLIDAYERLAARDTGGGESDHELESERERMLTESESPEVAKRFQFDRLYRSEEAAGGYRARLLMVVAVVAGVGAVLALTAWWLGGFGI